jgi:hypothetical protein
MSGENDSTQSRYSETFDALLIRRRQQRESVAKMLATLDLSDFYSETAAHLSPYPRTDADLSF